MSRESSRSSRVNIGPVKRLLALRTFDAFAALPVEELNVIAMHARPRLFKAGSVLSSVRDPVRYVYFLLEGKVVTHGDYGYYQELGPKSVVGGLDVLAQIQRCACRAVEDTLVLQLAADTLMDVFEDHFAITRLVIRNLAKEILSSQPSDEGERVAPDAGPDSSCSVVRRTRPVLGFVERMLYLRRGMEFLGVYVDASGVLARDAQEVRLADGELLWHSGEPARCLYLLVDGELLFRSVTEEREQIAMAGHTVGDLDVFSEENRRCDAVARGETVILEIAAETFFDVLEDQFEVARRLLRRLARNLVRLRSRPSDSSLDRASWIEGLV